MIMDQKRNSRQNQTRSLIEDGSEDFTNIEEHLEDNTRASIKNAVASSLNNVSSSKKMLCLLVQCLRKVWSDNSSRHNSKYSNNNNKTISDTEEQQLHLI